MDVASGERVLDLGCGTGTLLLMIKARQPGAVMTGIDPDPGILAVAAEKARRTGTEIGLVVGFGDRLPHADRSFDRVVSTLAFHHLTRREKKGTLSEAFRVLRPGGRLHITDVGRPRGVLMRAVTSPGLISERTRDNLLGHVPEYMADAGFVGVGEGERANRIFGAVGFYSATRPGM